MYLTPLLKLSVREAQKLCAEIAMLAGYSNAEEIYPLLFLLKKRLETPLNRDGEGKTPIEGSANANFAPEE